jgi:hypothetical protein
MVYKGSSLDQVLFETAGEICVQEVFLNIMASSHIMSHKILIWSIWEMGWSEICRFGVPGKCIGLRVQSCYISIRSSELGTPRQT